MDDPRYHTKRWQRLCRQIITRDGRRCSESPCTSDMTIPGMTHVDHIVEVDDGGSFWDPTNLHVLCKKHHFAKTLTVAAQRSQSQPVSPNR